MSSKVHVLIHRYSIPNPKIQNLMRYKIWSFLNQHETETNQKFSTWLNASQSQSQTRNKHTANTIQIIFRLCVKINSVFKWVPCPRNFILYRCKYCSLNVIKKFWNVVLSISNKEYSTYIWEMSKIIPVFQSQISYVPKVSTIKAFYISELF